MQSTKLVLGISNWHFNRDTQHLAEGPKCKTNNINITLKLASTAFGSEESGGSASALTSTSLGESQLKYDRNGATMPYSAFVDLMNQDLFHAYMKKVREYFERVEGPVSSCSPLEDEQRSFRQNDENEAGEEEEEEEETADAEEADEEIGKRVARKRASRVPLEEEEELDEEIVVSPDIHPETSSTVAAKKPVATRRGSKKKKQCQNPAIPDYEMYPTEPV